MKGLIVDINYELKCVHTSEGTVFYQDLSELTEIMDRSIREIISRPSPLARWEHWEIPDSNTKHIERLLMGRARNNEERALVRRMVCLMVD